MQRSESNPVGTLQELAQAKGGALPQYQLLHAVGESHCPNFTILVTFGGIKAEGKAASKKNAKHEAARNLLAIMKSDQEPKETNPETIIQETKSELNGTDKTDSNPNQKLFVGNKIGELQEYCTARCLPMPTYTECDTTGPAHSRNFTMVCEVGTAAGKGEGKTKKEAKRQAAGLVLEIISSPCHENVVSDNISKEETNNTIIQCQESEEQEEQKYDKDVTECSEIRIKEDSGERIDIFDEGMLNQKLVETNSVILEDHTVENTPELSD